MKYISIRPPSMKRPDESIIYRQAMQYWLTKKNGVKLQVIIYKIINK